MKKLIATVALVVAFASNSAAQTINNLGAGAAVSGTDMFPAYQGANPAKRVTAAQIRTYIESVWGTGCATFLATPSSANLRGCLTDEAGTGVAYFVGGALGTPASGTATNLTGLPISTGVSGLGTGIATWLATPSSANLAAALTDETGTGANVFGTAPTLSSPTINTAATFGFLTGSTQCLQVNTSGVLSGTGSSCSATSSSAVPSTQTGTNYPIVDGDRAKVIYLSNASAQTPTLPSAATLTNSNGWFVTACNIAAGIQTITPTTSTIGGAASYALPGGSAISPRCVNIVSDGTNYLVVPQGNVYLIASGTAAMGTSAITAGTCATVVTVSAPGVVTTDVVAVGFNGDPTATTGYLPTAMLTLVPYPTANNINVKACNLTGSSITPAALTLNWRVDR